MPSSRFIGRAHELEAIGREFDKARPSLIIVLGRRRVGKSTLLVKSIEKCRAIYYQATKIASSDSLALFKAEIARITGTDPLLESIASWQGIFSYLGGLAAGRHKGLIVVIDEFPYLCEVDSALPSVFQKFWDHVQANGIPLNVVLCGSKIAFMDALLAEKNPLHGRHSLKLDIPPLSYREAARFLPRWSKERRLVTFAIFGGIPFYLSQLDPGIGLRENILNLILTKGSPLADEPLNLLQAELRDVARYATVLRAIADGCTVSSDIIGRTKEITTASALAPYIEKLAELRLVRVVRSLDASERERDRRYYLNDPFLAFWYRFFLPHASAIAAGHGNQVYRYAIEPNLDDYMGHLFEWICRDHARLYLPEVTSIAAKTIGQIWAASYDIDVAGTLLDGSAIYGECKWRRNPSGESVLDRLIACADNTEYGRNASRRHFIIYSKSGFTKTLRRRAKSASYVHLLTPTELLD